MFNKVEKNKYLDHDVWESDIVPSGSVLNSQFIRLKNGRYTLDIRVNGTKIILPLRKNEAEHILNNSGMLHIEAEVVSSEFVK